MGDEGGVELGVQDAIQDAVTAASGGNCEEPAQLEIVQNGHRAYTVVWKCQEPSKRVEYECVLDRTRNEWTVQTIEQVAVASVVDPSDEGPANGPRRPAHLQAPLDLTGEGYERLIAILKSESEEFRVCREKKDKGGYSGWFASIYACERTGESEYDVRFYALSGNQPYRASHYRTEATLEGDSWSIGEIDVEYWTTWN